MKKHLGWAIRMLIAAAGVAYILYTLNWTSRITFPDGDPVPVQAIDQDWVTVEPGSKLPDGLASSDGRVSRQLLETGEADQPTLEPSFLVIVREANAPLLFGGFLLVAPVYLIGALRWTVLMRARGLDTRYWWAYRLTMAGQFFNLCMPGTTGGDVMKAYYAAKGTHHRADAVVSVAVDRVCGLIGLVLLVGIIGLFSLDDPLIRKLTISMWFGLAGILLVGGVYTSRTLRARLRLGRLVGKVPGAGMLRKIDALVSAYRNHLGALVAAVGMSLPIHFSLVCAAVMAGYALEIDQPLLYLLGTLPIVFMLWSLPVSGPLGLGPLDYVAVQLVIGTSQTTAQQAVMMFVAYRLYIVAVGLCGSLALMGTGAPSTKVPAEQDTDEGDAPTTTAA